VGRGIDTIRFNPARRDAELRRSWGVSDSDTVFAYVGRVAAEKNLDLLCQVYAVLESHSIAARFVVVGDGPMLESLKLRMPHALFLGQQSGETLARSYASADAFIFPSLTETYGNVVPEAMASGLAVLAFDCAAAGELIDHGVSGLLSPVASPGVFIELARVLAGDPGLRRSLAQKAREASLLNDWESVVGRLESVLQRTAAEQARSRRG
jgi:glycosyltransferase involved in cell wall biosynthesis